MMMVMMKYLNLNNRNDARDHDHQVGRFPVVPQTSSYDTEGCIGEHSTGSNLQENISL